MHKVVVVTLVSLTPPALGILWGTALCIWFMYSIYICVCIEIFSGQLFFPFCFPFLSTDSWASDDGDENLCGYFLLTLAIVSKDPYS